MESNMAKWYFLKTEGGLLGLWGVGYANAVTEYFMNFIFDTTKTVKEMARKEGRKERKWNSACSFQEDEDVSLDFSRPSELILERLRLLQKKQKKLALCCSNVLIKSTSSQQIGGFQCQMKGWTQGSKGRPPRLGLGDPQIGEREMEFSLPEKTLRYQIWSELSLYCSRLASLQITASCCAFSLWGPFFEDRASVLRNDALQYQQAWSACSQPVLLLTFEQKWSY